MCTAATIGHIPNHVNVWLQTPIYVILSFGKIFSLVSASEYAYSKAPKEMKTVVQAISTLNTGVGAILGMAISPAAKDPHLVAMYAALAAAMGFIAAVFWWSFMGYDRIDEEFNMLEFEKNKPRREM